ncbi:phosphotransferase [Streptomyces sp. NPDC052309]|uniref:phosphotransferase n=1 Tax=Streptomyces sp. NPDC052309 TaxID=3155421 RepID=UPI003435D338
MTAVSLDEITPAFLTDSLRGAEAITAAATVTSVDREPVGAGQVGDTYRYTLTYDHIEPTVPSSVIAKVSAADEASRAAAMQFELYEREVRFYQQIASKVGIRTPRCYGADIDVPAGTFVLLLEDLAPADTVNNLDELNPDHASAALAEAAGLHAPLWGAPQLGELDWLNFNHAQATVMPTITLPMFHGFAARYADSLDQHVLDLITRLKDHAPAFWTNQQPPWTVVHGDYRTDNMLFNARGGADPLVTVDWQTCGHGPAMTDVAFVLGTGLAPEVREGHEEALVRDYHDRLVSAGVAGYSFERCWQDYRCYAAYAVFLLVPSAMLVEQTERGDAMFLTMLRRAVAQIQTLDTEPLLAQEK